MCLQIDVSGRSVKAEKFKNVITWLPEPTGTNNLNYYNTIWFPQQLVSKPENSLEVGKGLLNHPNFHYYKIVRKKHILCLFLERKILSETSHHLDEVQVTKIDLTL